MKTVNILNSECEFDKSQQISVLGYLKGTAFEVDELTIANWVNAVETVCRATWYFQPFLLLVLQCTSKL